MLSSLLLSAVITVQIQTNGAHPYSLPFSVLLVVASWGPIPQPRGETSLLLHQHHQLLQNTLHSLHLDGRHVVFGFPAKLSMHAFSLQKVFSFCLIISVPRRTQASTCCQPLKHRFTSTPPQASQTSWPLPSVGWQPSLTKQHFYLFRTKIVQVTGNCLSQLKLCFHSPAITCLMRKLGLGGYHSQQGSTGLPLFPFDMLPALYVIVQVLSRLSRLGSFVMLCCTGMH